jgi:hypothetical protein
MKIFFTMSKEEDSIYEVVIDTQDTVGDFEGEEYTLWHLVVGDGVEQEINDDDGIIEYPEGFSFGEIETKETNLGLWLLIDVNELSLLNLFTCNINLLLNGTHSTKPSNSVLLRLKCIHTNCTKHMILHEVEDDNDTIEVVTYKQIMIDLWLHISPHC